MSRGGKHLPSVCLRGYSALPFPSAWDPAPGQLRWVFPPFRSPPKWTSTRRHLLPPGPLEHTPHPATVPACDLSSHLLRPVHRAPHNPHPQQLNSQGPRDLLLGYRGQTDGRGQCWVRRGGHSRAAVRGIEGKLFLFLKIEESPRCAERKTKTETDGGGNRDEMRTVGGGVYPPGKDHLP